MHAAHSLKGVCSALLLCQFDRERAFGCDERSGEFISDELQIERAFAPVNDAFFRLNTDTAARKYLATYRK